MLGTSIARRASLWVGLAAAAFLLLGTDAAHAFQDHGGWFARTVVDTDGFIYQSTRGYNSTNLGTGALWVFRPDPVCIDFSNLGGSSQSACDPMGTPTGCTGSEECSALRWVFVPGVDSMEATADIYGIPGVAPAACSHDFTIACTTSAQCGGSNTCLPKVVYVGSDNNYVYALPADPSAACLQLGSDGLPHLKNECVRWRKQTLGDVRAGVTIDPTTGFAYVGSQDVAGNGSGELYRFARKGKCDISGVECSGNPECTTPGDFCEGTHPLNVTGCVNDKLCANSQKKCWPIKTDHGRLRFTPIVDTDHPTDGRTAIYVGSDVKGLFGVWEDGEPIFCFDTVTSGNEKAQGYAVGGVLASDDKTLYAGTDVEVVKVDTDDLDADWTPSTPGLLSPIWRYAMGAGSIGRQQPVLREQSSGCHNVYESRRDPGNVQRIPGTCNNPPTECDNGFRFRVGGTISWSTPALSPPLPMPTPAGYVPTVVSGAHKDVCLYAIAADGDVAGGYPATKRWDFKSPIGNQGFFSSAAFSPSAETVYIGSNDGVLWALGNAGCTNCDSDDNEDRVAWCFRTNDGAGNASLRNNCGTFPAAVDNDCSNGTDGGRADPGAGTCTFP
jgi:hypothetical protein